MDMANMEKRYKHASEVKEYLGLSAEEEKVLENIISVFPMAVPSYYLSLIDPRDPDDSIRKMAIPSVRKVIGMGHWIPAGSGTTRWRWAYSTSTAKRR